MAEVHAPSGAAPTSGAEDPGPASGRAAQPVTLGQITSMLSGAGVRRTAPWERDFANLSYEWRRIFAELIGTFFLVLVAAGGGTIAAVFAGSVGRSAQVVAPALMVMVVILAIGAVSGAHLNPVVTIAFFLRAEFPLRRIPLYLVAQVGGAVVACLFLWAMFGKAGGLGATLPGGHVSDAQAMWMEAVLTCGLVTTILGTASGAQNVGPLSALAVGGYIALAGLWASPVSGASMNPVRSLGPAIVTGDYSRLWIYLAGPTIGMLAAVGIAYVLRGRGGDPAAMRAAQGTLPAFLPRRPDRAGRVPVAGTGQRARSGSQGSYDARVTPAPEQPAGEGDHGEGKEVGHGGQA
ncbi:MAG TPA: aquaporin [Acidimicrobiales bacterium]|nr:aquaporin [Acidimicrobiales bacterium]